MPILKRDDGIQFAIHAYRELLEPAKASILRNEVRMLAQNHGEYVRLYKQDGQIEAVFSREPGYLLGEAVWQYFNKPNDLIYCEAMPDGNFAIVVVVRGGNVYLDTKIPYTGIANEFASLVGINQYDIYVYGNVPISPTKEPGKFTFDKAQIRSFTRLPEPIFKTLPVNESLQLQPLQLALRGRQFGIGLPTKKIIIGIVALLIAYGIYHFLTRPKPVVAAPAATTATTEPPADPYQAYRSTLNSSPTPEQQLSDIANVINLVYDIPGWNTTAVNYSGNNYTVTIVPLGGSMTALSHWTQEHNMTMNLSASGAALTKVSNLPMRPPLDTIYPVNQLVYTFIDKIDGIMPDRSVTLGNTANLGVYKTTDLTVQITNAAPTVLKLLGKQFGNLPVKVNTAQFTLTQGLLSGTVQLTVLGN